MANEKKAEEKKVEEKKVDEKKAEEKVKYMVPYIEGEPEEVNITVNGDTIQVLRGEMVEIPNAHAEVLENQARQAKAFKKKQAELKEQVTVEE